VETSTLLLNLGGKNNIIGHW